LQRRLARFRARRVYGHLPCGDVTVEREKTPNRIRENFDLSEIPDDAFAQLNAVSTRYRFNPVVDTGLPGLIPQG
jgi:alcohol dehydrogenase (NADP+)